MKRLIFVATLLSSIVCQAQNFDYRFRVADTTYSEVIDPTILAEGTQWLASNQSVSIGFTFKYLGTNFQSVTVTDDGYVAFGSNYRFYCFGLQLSNQKDSIGTNMSSISYLTQGETGNRVMYIQFKNCKVYNDTTGYINFQVRLMEKNNQIALIVGDTRFEPSVLGGNDKKVGLWSQSVSEGVVLNGNAAAPASAHIPAGGSFLKITGYPATNKMYLFTPNF